MEILNIINLCLGVIFTLLYFYQFVYLFVAYAFGVKKFPDASPSRIAILIAARNEAPVITNLINSLTAQDYPRDMMEIFVVADNCTDNTAEVARAAGAKVYERFNTTLRGKGYALDYLIKALERDYGDNGFDAYIVFDADNIAEPNYVTEMNKAFRAGYEVVTSYRNASNYGAGWRAGGQGMYFLREGRVLNMARMRMGANNYVTGTGFLFSREVCRQNGGWPFNCLTEDGEFTMDNCVKGIKSGYCNDAVFYDEQAVDFKTSWYQKLRWCKGGTQIFIKYFPQLVKGIFSKRILASWDMAVCLFAAYIISLTAVITNVVGVIVTALMGKPILEMIIGMAVMVGVAYLMLEVFSVMLTVSEWRRIRASSFKKILYMLTFPLFLFSFVPAAFVALFKRVEWKPVRHSGEQTEASDSDKEK